MTTIYAHRGHSKQEQCCHAAGDEDRVPNAANVCNESGDDAAKDASNAQDDDLGGIY